MARFKLFGWCVVAALVVAASAQSVRAQVNAGVLFLRIQTGARAAGMGGAFVALADDASATHWNPAGLGAYPLNSQWSAHPMTAAGQVLDAVALRNQLPYHNFQGYDLWILTADGMRVFRIGGGETDQITLETESVGSLGAAVRRYAPFLSEDEADLIARQAVSAQAGISADEMEASINRVLNSIPDGYRDRTLIEGVVRDFRVAFKEGRVELDRLPELRTAIAALPESGPATDETSLDRARFAMEHSISPMLPSTIAVRLADLLKGPITAIAGDGDILYVASGSGLVSFDGSRWDRVSTPADVADWGKTTINCLKLTSGRHLWAGTNDGVYVLYSGKWTKYGAESGLPSTHILKMAFSDANSGWVQTDQGLTHYDGKEFSTAFEATANLGDSLDTIIGRFMDSQDPQAINRAAVVVRQTNKFSDDFAATANAKVLIPYGLGLHGDVTAMTVDGYGRLWVGTTLGTFRFWRGEWNAFGYEPVTVTAATTTEQLARDRLGSRATDERVQRLTHYINAYNELPDGQIEAGRVVYVYRNPAGSRVNDLLSEGDILYVATEVGQLAVESGQWGRYYHDDLDRDEVGAVESRGGDVWFVTSDRVVIYQHPSREFSFMYAPWLPDFNLDLYYIYPTVVTHINGIGTVGVSVPFLSFGQIDRRDELGNVGASFNSFDMAAAVSYGTRLTPSLAAGLSAKFIYSRLADQGAGAEIGSGSGTAFAMDAGLLYDTPWKRLTLGLAVTNIGPNISYIDAQQSDPLPRNLALGFAYQIFNSTYNHLVLVGDLNKEIVSLKNSNESELKQIVYNAGFEYRYGSFLAGRAGYIYDQDGQVKTPTLGFGVSLQTIKLDLAYIPSSKDLPLANTIFYSLSGRF
jgi:hypothetical protein